MPRRRGSNTVNAGVGPSVCPEEELVIQLAAIDLAGTLVRDDGAVESAFADALRAVEGGDGSLDGHALDVVRRTMGRSKISVFRELLGDEQLAQLANSEFEAAYARRIEAGQTTALDGAGDALHALRSAGVRVAVTTGFSETTRDLLLESLGWASIVDLALSPTDELRGRPGPDLVLAAVIRLRVDDVRQVAVVGDTSNDLIAGSRAGAGIVAGVLTGAHGRAGLEAAPHTHILDSIAELPELVKGS